MSTTLGPASALHRLHLLHPPVAVAFLDTPPPGLQRLSHSDPASCSYWARAADGEAFYTTSDDHQNCPVGAFTHGAELSPAKTQELHGLIGTMVELNYLKPDDVPQIPHRTAPLQVAAYAPLKDAAFPPDVVIFRGTPKQIMLVSEAARRAGVFESGAVMGRPACAMLPQSIASGDSVASVGCIGNRVYTGLADDELYISVPGATMPQVLDALDTILEANVALEQFHQARADAHRG